MYSLMYPLYAFHSATAMYECKLINNIYETEYIYKAIIVCNDPYRIFSYITILSNMLYPIGVLTYQNFQKTISDFYKGKLRLLVISDVMFDIITTQYSKEFEAVNVIFTTDESNLEQTSVILQNSKIFSLSK
jgi:hypothetical protein